MCIVVTDDELFCLIWVYSEKQAPGNNEHEIREAFRVFSQSAQTASVNTQSYNALGGFGNQNP